MRYRRQAVRCNLCGFDRYEVVYRQKVAEGRAPGTITIVRCLRCGLVYLGSAVDAKEYLKRYMEMVNGEYVREEKGWRLSSNVILDRIAAQKRGGRLLDVGCAAGFLLDEARRRKFEVCGVELSGWAARYAREKLDLNVFKGTLAKAKFPPKHFDVIVMVDLLEHLPDPKEALLEVRRILKDNGILYLSAPNISSFLSQFLKSQWWGINIHHLYYFSRKTLEDLLYATGFKAVRYASHIRAHSLRYWAERLSRYNTFISSVLDFLSRIIGFRSLIMKVSFSDQVEVSAVKLRRLDFLVDRLEERKTRKEMKTIVVLPAYNAEKTLKRTVDDIPKDAVDDIILIDDVSGDKTVAVAKKLGLKVFVHKKNTGYGGNQKTCYQKALDMGADIVVMVHPDYQYDPAVIPQLIEPIKRGEADAVFGSRMMKGGALEGGMPLWKHNVNILLTAFENVMMGIYLTEFHSGFRAYSSKALRTINFAANSDNFVFDTEIIAQLVIHNFKIDEIPIRCRYFEEASNIKFIPAVIYGLSIIWTMFKYVLHAKGIYHFRQFE